MMIANGMSDVVGGYGGGALPLPPIQKRCSR